MKASAKSAAEAAVDASAKCVRTVRLARRELDRAIHLVTAHPADDEVGQDRAKSDERSELHP